MKIRNLFNRKKSREIAKDRLKILLISDRVNCSPEMMEMIKKGVSAEVSQGALDALSQKHGDPDRKNGSEGQGYDAHPVRQYPDPGST